LLLTYQATLVRGQVQTDICHSYNANYKCADY
jgi:hypothetical protein